MSSRLLKLTVPTLMLCVMTSQAIAAGPILEILSVGSHKITLGPTSSVRHIPYMVCNRSSNKTFKNVHMRETLGIYAPDIHKLAPHQCKSMDIIIPYANYQHPGIFYAEGMPVLSARPSGSPNSAWQYQPAQSQALEITYDSSTSNTQLILTPLLFSGSTAVNPNGENPPTNTSNIAYMLVDNLYNNPVDDLTIQTSPNISATLTHADGTACTTINAGETCLAALYNNSSTSTLSAKNYPVNVDGLQANAQTTVSFESDTNRAIL